MRRGYNQHSTFVDTGLLRDHVSRLREEKKIATRLHESVVAMRNSDTPTEYYKYNSVLYDIEQLIEYFEKMAELLDRASEDAVQLSQESKIQIEHNADQMHHTALHSFML